MTAASQCTRFVVVDTNVLWSSGEVEQGVGWQELLTWAEHRPDVGFVVPEVVVLELARQEADRQQKSFTVLSKQWNKALGALRYAGVRIPEIVDSSVDLATIEPMSLDDVGGDMRKKLAERGIRLWPVPEGCSHLEMLRKSLVQHPPFDETDKGYRDALIWETVCELAAEATDGAVVVLVTSDKDFREEGAEDLHPKLVEEFGQRICASVAVGIAQEIRGAIEHEGVHPNRNEESSAGGSEASASLPPAEDSPGAVSPPGILQLVQDGIADLCERRFDGEHLRFDGHESDGEPLLFGEKISSDISDPTVNEVLPDLGTVALDEHETFESGTEIGSATVEATVEYEGLIYKADYYGSDGEWQLVDSDWNDNYFRVTGSFETELEFRYVADPAALLALEFVPKDG